MRVLRGGGGERHRGHRSVIYAGDVGSAWEWCQINSIPPVTYLQGSTNSEQRCSFFYNRSPLPLSLINKLFFCFGYALDKAECHDLMLKVMSESTIESMQTKETTTFEELRARLYIRDKEMCSDGPG